NYPLSLSNSPIVYTGRLIGSGYIVQLSWFIDRECFLFTTPHRPVERTLFNVEVINFSYSQLNYLAAINALFRQLVHSII
ncbi:hypothetical protein MRX50_19130, partial [Fusibacter sp. A2]|uniref:hypothetical protein n=1 Tax=Fusibacter sp. A2 TaxID=2929473 RepID=UPI0020BFFA70